MQAACRAQVVFAHAMHVFLRYLTYRSRRFVFDAPSRQFLEAGPDGAPRRDKRGIAPETLAAMQRLADTAIKVEKKLVIAMHLRPANVPVEHSLTKGLELAIAFGIEKWTRLNIVLAEMSQLAQPEVRCRSCRHRSELAVLSVTMHAASPLVRNDYYVCACARSRHHPGARALWALAATMRCSTRAPGSTRSASCAASAPLATRASLRPCARRWLATSCWTTRC